MFYVLAASLSAAVHEILLPIMKEIKNDFNSVKDNLNSVKDDLNSVKDDLNSVKNDLSSLNKTVSGDLKDYKQQTASELAGLQSNVTSTVISTCTDFLPLDCCQV